MHKILIAAVAKNNVIGKSSGEELWHSEEDLKHFKDTTLGFPIIMGRKTFEVLKKPLESRLNLIISNNFDLKKKFSEIEVFNSLKNACAFCESRNYEKVFIIGGGQLFSEAISHANELIISHMNFIADGDLFFPKIDLNKWNIKSRKKLKDFEIVNYVRTN